MGLIPGSKIDQPRLRIVALAGEGVIGGGGAFTIQHFAVGGVALSQGNVAIGIGHLADASQCIRQEIAGLGSGYLSDAVHPIQVRVGPVLQHLSQPGVEVQGVVGGHAVLELAEPVA